MRTKAVPGLLWDLLCLAIHGCRLVGKVCRGVAPSATRLLLSKWCGCPEVEPPPRVVRRRAYLFRRVE
jgi:hypothetical protein